VNNIPPYADDSDNNMNKLNDNELGKCPAFDICSELHTARDLCRNLNEMPSDGFLLKPQSPPDLHGIQVFGDVEPETPDTVIRDYQETLEDYNKEYASHEAIEARRIYDKLDHLQCCFSSIVLLLANKSKS
jgi:hypothetical protein